MFEIYQEYAEYYDLTNQDKDYERECDFLEMLFKDHSYIPIKSLIDAGCGTGAHAIPLAKRGYEVVGIDASEEMIKRARRKAEQAKLEVDFGVMDLRQLSSDSKFDAAICMFDVIDYLTTDDDLQKVLRNIRGVLKEGALFIFDCWNGLAVLKTFHEVSLKEVQGEGKRIIRWIRRDLDAFHNLCRNHHHVIVIQEGTIIDEMEETHVIRYYFPQEIAHHLGETGFELVNTCPLLAPEENVDDMVWSITAIARAKPRIIGV